MIEKVLLGKTPFGGEVFYIHSDRPYDIPAVRIFVSMQRTMRDLVEEQIDSMDGFIDYVNRHPEISKQYVRRILSYHHGDVGEMDEHGIYLNSVSRLLTFLTWIPIGANRGVKGVGTELSLRYSEGKGSINLPSGRLSRVDEESGELYVRLRERRVVKEDARYVLPLMTRTEEIMHVQLGRDLAKWANYLKNEPFEEAKVVGETLLKWNESESGFTLPKEEVPPARMPLLSKDEDSHRRLLEVFLADKQSKVHYDPYTQSLVWNSIRSISSFHQDVRNRQVYFWWPSWESTISDSDFYVPPRLPEGLRLDVQNHYSLLLDVSRRFCESGDWQSAVYSMPLGKKMDVYCALYGNWNIYETVRLRSCMRVQLEIRNQYRLIAEKLKNVFPGKLGARCEVEGVCFEPQREKCPLYRLHIIKQPKTSRE
ncbi:MAG: FAD-dependent thymidylate synthase [Candidatus Bathyarchaeia archaeon]